VSPDDDASAVADSLTPGQVAALAHALRSIAAALKDISDRLGAIERLLDAHLDADRAAVNARALAWRAVATAATSRPGQALGLLAAGIVAAALAELLGVDLDSLRRLVGLGVGA